MKLLKDYPGVHSLLQSSVYEDVLIGIELLKQLNLSDDELLEMMPAKMVNEPDRDHHMNAKIPETVVLIPITENLSIYMTSSWIFCIRENEEKEAYT